MKNRFLIALAALSILAVGCKDDKIGNPGEMLANTDEVYSDRNTSATAVISVYGNGIAESGVCWGTTNTPTLDGFSASDGQSGAGTFTIEMTGLTAASTYYARAYAMDSGGNVTYGSTRVVTTPENLTATITGNTPGITSIEVKGKIAGGHSSWVISERGVYYGKTPNPVTTGTKLAAAAGGSGDFTVNITGLETDEKYYVQTYAVSDVVGTLYSAETIIGTANPFLDELIKAKLTYGVVRDASTAFVMHYTLDLDTRKITITYIETTGNQDAKHVTKDVDFNNDFTEMTWETVSYNGNDFSGIIRSGSTFSVKGTSGLTLDPGMPENDVYKMFVKKEDGGLGRCSETRNKPCYHASIASIFTNGYGLMEMNGGYNGLMTKYNPGSGENWLCYEYTSSSGKPAAVTGDKVTVAFKSYFWGHADNPTICDAGWTALEPFRNLLFNPKGFYVVREVKATGTVDDGAFNYFMIRSDGVEWYKWYFRNPTE